MKQLTLLLFSLILSFNSYGEWNWITADLNGDKHYIDFENFEVDTNGYLYYWEMINYTNTTEKYLSIATYRVADCDLFRTIDLALNGYTQNMAEGTPEMTELNEDWVQHKANSYAGFNLKNFICSD